MQDEHGFGEIVSAIMRAAEKRLEQLNRRQGSMGLRPSWWGVQCGGSDAFSGVTCNPAVGYAAEVASGRKQTWADH